MIEIVNISKDYGNGKKVLNDVNIHINKGEFVVLIGESGCGKTTTMKMINKLIEPTSGKIYIDGKNINDLNSNELRRNIGYVIQKVGLMPHMTIGENIELVPTLLNWTKERKLARSKELLELVELDPDIYYDRFPNELSGGQRQRIGIARALAVNPDIILMDEPFSALDPITRENLQDEMIKLQNELHKTIVFVTHDMDEALKLGDKIAVLKDGEVLQYDTPENILKNPANEFVEYFIGKDRLWKKPEMLLVKDIMRKNYPKIDEDGSVARAIEKMKEKELDFIVVGDKIGDDEVVPVGIVLRRHLFSKGMDHDITMKDIMKTKFNTVNEDTNLLEVLKFMSGKKFKVLPVIGEKGFLKGVITPSSLLNVISEIAPTLSEGVDEIDE